jgi:O-antigen ligase
VATYQLWAPDGVIERIEMTSSEENAGSFNGAHGAAIADAGKMDASTESRFLLWAGGMQLLGERPWGIGLYHFHRDIGRVVPSYANYDSHNGFVLVATECGPQGFLAMVWLLMSLVFLARKVERVDGREDTKVLGGAFLVASIGVVFANLFGSRIFNGEVMANFWILAGISARYMTLQQERVRQGVEEVRPAPLAGTPAIVARGR